MPHRLTSPWAGAIAAGLLWGLASPDLLGAALIVLGMRAAVLSIDGTHADLLRGALAGGLFGALFLRWLPGVWTMAGGSDALLYINLLVLALALAMALTWALASMLVRHDTPPAWAFVLSTAALAEPFAALLPVPVVPALLSCSSSILVWPATLGGATALAWMTSGTGALLGSRVGAMLGAAWVCVGLALEVMPPSPGDQRVGVLLPDTDAFDGNRASRKDHRRQTLQRLYDEAAAHHPDWIVIPETAWPDPEPPRWATRAIVGMNHDGTNALVLAEQGEILHHFSKKRLIAGLEEVRAGEGPRYIDVGDTRVAPLICYEDFFPSSIRDALQHDPALLVAATNDSWVTGTPGQGWHLAAARLSAASAGRWMLRPANGGVSAVLDHWGRTRWTAPASGSGRQAIIDIARLHPWTSGASLSPWLCLLLWLRLVYDRRSR